MSVNPTIAKFVSWLTKAPKGIPVDQELAWDTAHQLVEKWREGWKDAEAEQPDRRAILSECLNSEGGVHLLAIMRHIGPLKALTEVGADDEMAANIVTVGTASELINIK